MAALWDDAFAEQYREGAGVSTIVARSRLKLESIRGGFDGQLLAAGSAELVVTCRRTE